MRIGATAIVATVTVVMIRRCQTDILLIQALMGRCLVLRQAQWRPTHRQGAWGKMTPRLAAGNSREASQRQTDSLSGWLALLCSLLFALYTFPCSLGPLARDVGARGTEQLLLVGHMEGEKDLEALPDEEGAEHVEESGAG